MFRYKKSNKQAYIIAALIIMLCLVCLAGATLALFTSDPNDGTIGVVTTSGDVEVDIVDKEGNSLKNESLNFITSATNPEPLFEPGATFYTQEFRVQNNGNIPVNFTVSVSKDDNIDMTEFDEAFEVWIVRANDPDFANAQHITKFKGTDLMPGKSSETYCLFVKMKESATNEFQGKTYTGIGITVYAVQGNAEIKE